MNRFRKTGTYIKPENGLAEFGADVAASARMATTITGEAPPDYGDEYGGEGEYEGGEMEFGGLGADLDAESSRQERVKEELELVKFQEFYNIAFAQRLL